MNIFLNEYFGFCFESNFELNHFHARFKEKMNFKKRSPTPNLDPKAGRCGPKISLSHGVKRSPEAVAEFSPQLLILDILSQKYLLSSLE